MIQAVLKYIYSKNEWKFIKFNLFAKMFINM